MKICPTCDQQFEDDVQKCPDDGAVLVAPGVKNNPKIPGVRAVDANAHTAMFQLDDMKDEKERLSAAADEPEVKEEPGDKTNTAMDVMRPPDRDATKAFNPADLERERDEKRKNGEDFAEGGDTQTQAPQPTKSKTKVKGKGK